MRVRIPPRPFVKVSIYPARIRVNPLTRILAKLSFFDRVFVVQPLTAYLLNCVYRSFRVGGLAVVVTEGEFVYIAVKVFFAHMVECTSHATLEWLEKTAQDIGYENWETFATEWLEHIGAKAKK